MFCKIQQYVINYYIIGEARWLCGYDGEWQGRPDLADCISAWMEDIKEVVRFVLA